MNTTAEVEVQATLGIYYTGPVETPLTPDQVEEAAKQVLDQVVAAHGGVVLEGAVFHIRAHQGLKVQGEEDPEPGQIALS